MAEPLPDDGEAPVIVSLADAAMHMYTAAINSLPHSDDAEFGRRAAVVLDGLRTLKTALKEAGRRGRSTPSVIVALSGVRTCYDDLMERVAAAPGATLGQQLYVARRRAKLSAEETANGVGLNAGLLDAVEAGENPTEEQADRIKTLVAALGG
jgi:hypothetical protein